MAVSQINRALIRPVTIAAAVTGAIQALAWTSLSLVSILYYYSVILIDDSLPTNSYAKIIYHLFLNPDNKDQTIIVTPRVFDIFMIIFMASNFVWLVASLYILWAMTRERWKAGFAAVGGWSALALYIAILDIVLMSLIAADFNTVLHTDLTGDISTAPPIETTPIPSTVGSSTPSTVFPSSPELAETDPATDYTTGSESESTTDHTTEFESKLYTREAFAIVPEIALGHRKSAIKPAIVVKLFGKKTNRLDLDGVEYLYPEINLASQQIVNTSYGIIMTLAARGYILLIVNIVFAIILMKFAFVIRSDEAPSLLPIIGAYATGSRPWNNLYEQTDISNGYANDAFRDENDQSAFPRSDSFIANDTQIRNQNPLSNGANPYRQNFERNEPSPSNSNVFEGRLAKIGKKSGKRTPPLNVPPPVTPNMPYIPDPDYSPPGSPRSKPKSVLRPKSNYVL